MLTATMCLVVLFHSVPIVVNHFAGRLKQFFGLSCKCSRVLIPFFGNFCRINAACKVARRERLAALTSYLAHWFKNFIFGATFNLSDSLAGERDTVPLAG